MTMSLTEIIGNAEKSFALPVLIQMLGEKPVEARFKFKYRKSDEFQTFLSAAEKMTEEEIFNAVVVGWEFKEEFSSDNVKRLLDVCPQAPASIARAYVAEYRRVMLG